MYTHLRIIVLLIKYYILSYVRASASVQLPSSHNWKSRTEIHFFPVRTTKITKLVKKARPKVNISSFR